MYVARFEFPSYHVCKICFNKCKLENICLTKPDLKSKWAKPFRVNVTLLAASQQMNSDRQLVGSTSALYKSVILCTPITFSS